MKLSEIKYEKRAIFLGDQGTGKTRLLGTLCQLVPTVLVTSDLQGLATIRNMPECDPEIVYVENWDNIWDYYQQIAKAVKAGAQAIAVDDFGGTQEQLARRLNLKPKDMTEARTEPGKRQEDIRKAMMMGSRRLLLQQWGEMALGTESWLYEILQLPVDVKWFTVLSGLRDHPRTGEDWLMPELMGQARDRILAKFGLVVNTFHTLHKGAVYWCATSKPHPRIPTKDRYSQPRTWVDPTAAKILQHIIGKEDVETATEKEIGTGISS